MMYVYKDDDSIEKNLKKHMTYGFVNKKCSIEEAFFLTVSLLHNSRNSYDGDDILSVVKLFNFCYRKINEINPKILSFCIIQITFIYLDDIELNNKTRWISIIFIIIVWMLIYYCIILTICNILHVIINCYYSIFN